MLIAVLMPLVAATGSQGDLCLKFEPAVESITGKLVKRTFAGPPEYQSVEKGDMPEVVYLLELVNPICFYGTPGDELNSQDVAGVAIVQVGPTDEDWLSFKKLAGKRVKAVGTFLTAHTAHHRAPVLMNVTRLEKAR